MTRRLQTTRTQIARLLDPKNDSIQLDTIHKAAEVVSKRLAIILEDLPRSAA